MSLELRHPDHDLIKNKIKNALRINSPLTVAALYSIYRDSHHCTNVARAIQDLIDSKEVQFLVFEMDSLKTLLLFDKTVTFQFIQEKSV
jgi:hypothetical protein